MRNSWETLKARLSEAFQRHGAISEFCRTTGFARSGVDRWMRGESVPSLASLDAISNALGLEPWKAIIPPEADVEIDLRAIAADAAQIALERVPGRSLLPADVAALARDLAALDEDKRRPLMAGFTVAVEYQLSLQRSRPATPKRQKQS